MIELRSDTFTMPTPAMLRAINSARLGNDGYGEDPTVRALEERAANLLGMPAACMMPSGTMANLACLMVHCPRGSTALVGMESDIYLYEAAGASVCGGIGYTPLPNQPDGRILLDDLHAAIPDDQTDPQFAPPALICLENTQNRCGGTVLTLDYLREVRELADHNGLAVHIDGARLFNAAVAMNVSARAITRYADSVQICLSKGLSAPVGSIAAGRREFVEKVRRVRKMLGGGMRQAGLLAAAGLVALESVDQLAEDHANATALAAGLATVMGIRVDPPMPRTNIVLFRVDDPRFTWKSFVDAARRRDLAVAEFGHGRIRAVTHSGVTSRDVQTAITIVRDVLEKGPT